MTRGDEVLRHRRLGIDYTSRGLNRGFPKIEGVISFNVSFRTLQDDWANKVALVNHDKLTEWTGDEK